MRQRLRTCFSGVVRLLAALCLVLAVWAWAAWLHGPASVTATVIGALALVAGGLAWRIYRQVHALHGHAQDHADAAAEAERHYFGVLEEVVRAVEARDRIGAGRSDRISALCVQMARSLGLEPAHADLLGRVARVHDIGLLAVSDAVLGKTTSLSGSEHAGIQRHCERSERILRPLTFLAPVLDAVRHHHERMNGTGYPDGLSGEAIPLAARILAVADSYEAMTHDRPYRRALTSRQAVAELVRCASTGYDPACVRALAEAVHATDLLTELVAGPAADSREAEAPHTAPVPF